MFRGEKFWVCGNCGSSVPIEQQPILKPLPSDHPFSHLIGELPTPIAFVLYEFFAESHPYITLHRLCDAAEIITRFFTIIALSDLLRQHGQFPEPVQDALTEKIERPTFGAWKELLQIACQNLKGCFVDELPEFVKEQWLPALGGGSDNPEKAIIALRNFIVHSARLPQHQAQELLDAHREKFENLVKGLSFLTNYHLVACTKEEGLILLKGLPVSEGFHEFKEPVNFETEPERVYLLKGTEGLDLFPLHAFTEILQLKEGTEERLEEVAPQVYFRLSERGYLEFVPFSQKAAFSQLRGSVYERFRQIFRLEEWRAKKRKEREEKGLLVGFEERIAELTEVFVGREEHIEKVKEAIKAAESGVLWISGKPGVGKSALMAKLARDYQGQQHYITFPYFFRIGEIRCSKGEFLSSALRFLGSVLGRKIEPERELPERERQFVEVVKEVATTKGKKVLFLIDGLDEIWRKGEDFIRLPFMAQGERIVWVCAGRPEAGLEKEMEIRGAIKVFGEEGLPPLKENAVRAMLIEHLGRLKYELLERDDEEGRNRFIEVVTKKSQGLPLYVRMVIEDLKAGKWTINDEDKLPEGLNAYFDDILERLRVSDVGSVLTPMFCLLAWAKEPLSDENIKYLLKTHHLSGSREWDDLVRKAFEQGHMMLQRQENRDGELGWAFYHESFREHLLGSDEVKLNLEWAQRRWLEVGKSWESLEKEEPSLFRYILRHYAEHLSDAVTSEGEAIAEPLQSLFDLARNEKFAQ
ncbi:NACHT domain-containing protein, partial [Candidatus Fervidibacteria bacterium JGI MDM2 JNZ-1-D12]